MTGTLPPVTSACPGQGTAGATTSRAKLFLSRLSTHEQNVSAQGWHKNEADSSKNFPATPGKVGIREKKQQHILQRVQDITNAFRK